MYENQKYLKDYKIYKANEKYNFQPSITIQTSKNYENKSEQIKFDLSMYKEYVQWNFINNKLYKKFHELLNIKCDWEERELKNVVQRWLIFINENFNEVKKFEYFTILPQIPPDHLAADYLKKALIEKFACYNTIDKIIKDILAFISSNNSRIPPFIIEKPSYVKLNIMKGSRYLIINYFEAKLTNRLNLLIQIGGLKATAIMLLRYESLGIGSYQWGDPTHDLKMLHDVYDVRFEGFASPLNSRYLELYPGSKFCSLFPDIDQVFGSIGDFFHVDFNKWSGGWQVNPPFESAVMKRVAERIIQTLDANIPCWFFCTFPHWEDDDSWCILNQSIHCYFRYHWRQNTVILEGSDGIHRSPIMSKSLFVLGKVPGGIDSTSLSNSLKKID